MFAERPAILLVNTPVVVPSVVFVLNAVVGLVVVLQQTPLTVIVAPPLLVMLPPPVAVVCVIEVAEVVVRFGTKSTTALVENVICDP